MDAHNQFEEESNDDDETYYTEASQGRSSPSQGAIMVPGKVSSLPMAVLDEESTVLVSSNVENDMQGTRTRYSKVSSVLLREMMRNREHVKILPILLGIAGFMESDIAKKAIRQLLEIDFDLPNGFSSHHLVATKDCQLGVIDSTIQSIYNYGIQSSKLIGSKHVDIEIEIWSKFQERLLDRYMEDLLFFLKDNSQVDTERTAKILSSIRKGRIALIKVWNISFNSNVLYFLRRFSDYLTQLRLWLFTDLKEVEMGLRPIAHQEEDIKLWFTCLHYLLRSVKLCNGAAESMHEQKPSRVFVSLPDNCSKKILTEEAILKIQKLEENLRNGAEQLKVNHCLKEKVSTFDSNSKYHLYIKELLLSDVKSIPLSMLFLRGALENYDSIFIEKSFLHLLAEKCDLNINDFCEFFTSFGSLFDLSLVKPNSNTVIIKPDIFLMKINKAFDYLESNSEREYTRNGILTLPLVNKLFGSDGRNFMTALSDVGMSAVIEPGKYMDNRQRLNKEICYYMPCARKMKQNHLSDEMTTVHLLLDIQRPPNFLNFEVFFTSFILANSSHRGFLLSSEYENVTIMKHFDDSSADKYMCTSISYRGSHVEIAIKTSLGLSDLILLDHIKCIISAVEQIATNSVKKGRFTYGFAVICSIDGEHHVLPEDLCTTCARNRYFQIWIRALTEKPVKQGYKFKTEITLDDVTFLARVLQSYNKDILILFGKEFDDEETVYDDFESIPWAFLMTVITKWMKNRSVTKADLARKVLALSAKTTIQDTSASLKRLARCIFQRVIKETSTVTTT